MQISVHSMPSMCVKSMAKLLFALEFGWFINADSRIEYRQRIFFTVSTLLCFFLKCLQHDSKLHSTNIIPCLNKTRKVLEARNWILKSLKNPVN